MPVSEARKVPAWVIALVAALSAGVAFIAFWFVIIVVAFGCDSGWEGCGDAGGNAVFVYFIVAGLAFVGGLIWAIVGASRTQQILACILMPVGVIVGVVAAIAYYAMMASRAGGVA